MTEPSAFNKDKPYIAPRGRWGDSIPSIEVPVYNGNGDIEIRKVYPDVEGNYVQRQRRECGGKGSKEPATDPRKNKTPRKDDPRLWTYKPVVAEFAAAFGESGMLAMGTPTDGLPFDPALVRKSLGMQYRARAERMPRRKKQ